MSARCGFWLTEAARQRLFVRWNTTEGRFELEPVQRLVRLIDGARASLPGLESQAASLRRLADSVEATLELVRFVREELPAERLAAARAAESRCADMCGVLASEKARSARRADYILGSGEAALVALGESRSGLRGMVARLRSEAASLESRGDEVKAIAGLGLRTTGPLEFETHREAWRAHGLARGVLALLRQSLATAGVRGAPADLATRWFECASPTSRRKLTDGLGAAFSRGNSDAQRARVALKFLLGQRGCLPAEIEPLADYAQLATLLTRIDRGPADLCKKWCCDACKVATRECARADDHGQMD